MLHPVGHLSLAVGAQLQAGPVGEDDLEGVGPIRGVGSPTATALLPPGPEEEGEMGRGGRDGTGELSGLVEACRPGAAPEDTKGWSGPHSWAAPPPPLSCVTPLISRITRVLLHTEQGQVRSRESALSPTLSESAHAAPRGPDAPSRCMCVHLPLRSGASQGKDCLPIRLDPFQAGSSFCFPQVPPELSRPQGSECGWG